MRGDVARLMVETLVEELVSAEQDRDRYRAEAQSYRLLALVALDHARTMTITRDDGRDRYIYADQVLERVV